VISTRYDTPPVDQWQRSPLGLLVPPAAKRRYTAPTGIDFFAGAGGFSMGFHQSGFHMVAAVELDTAAAMTYLVNLGRAREFGGVQMHYDTDERGDKFERDVSVHLGLRGRNGNAMSASAQRGQHGSVVRGGMLAGEGWIAGEPLESRRRGCEHFWLADIRNLTGAQLLEPLGLDVGELDVIVGGPPCQGFSAAGKREVMDPRNSLVFEYARIITEIQPKAFVMENVPQIESMVTPEGVPVLDAFAYVVAEGGYSTYEALRRALASMGGKAAVKGRKRVGRPRRKGEGQISEAEATRKVKSAAKTAQAADGQLDLFGGAA
jgi:DNA (cytosine-5)-methyltransferase 1